MSQTVKDQRLIVLHGHPDELTDKIEDYQILLEGYEIVEYKMIPGQGNGLYMTILFERN